MIQPPSTRQLFDRFVAAAAAAAVAAPKTPRSDDAELRVEANTALVHRYFEMWNTGDGSVADVVIGATYLDHAHPEVLGPAALRSLVPRFHAANPDAHMRVEIAAADADFVAVRNTISRTVDGQSIVVEGIALFRVVANKLAEQWSLYPQAEECVERSQLARRALSFETWLSFRA